jgi:hypothetical protein
MNRAIFVSLVLLAGCGESELESVPAPRQRIDLTAALGVDARPVGTAIDPRSGQRYVLDASSGLYEVRGDALVRVWSSAQIPSWVTPQSAFTDIVGLGHGRFAVTARNEGFELDLPNAGFELYFCYEPGWLPEELEQATEAVTFDPSTSRLYAQPLTVDATGAVVANQVGAFDSATGAESFWLDLPDLGFTARGMAALDAERLVLARGTELFAFATGGGELARLADLAALGIDAIEGLALDGDALFVVTATELLELPALGSVR